jgi:hypothetical protein
MRETNMAENQAAGQTSSAPRTGGQAAAAKPAPAAPTVPLKVDAEGLDALALLLAHARKGTVPLPGVTAKTVKELSATVRDAEMKMLDRRREAIVAESNGDETIDG